MARNYAKELKWQATTEQKKRRAARNKARRQAIREGLVKKGDGKDIDHKNMNPLDNRKSNLRVMKSSANKKRQPATKTRKK